MGGTHFMQESYAWQGVCKLKSFEEILSAYLKNTHKEGQDFHNSAVRRGWVEFTLRDIYSAGQN